MTIRQKFKSAIERGTGEAHLIMKNHPDMDFSNSIIKAALKNLSYDNQSEGSRATYVFELIEMSNQKEKNRHAVLKGLATERTDTWALVQLFDIAAQFAKNGDADARNAIYKRFNKKIIRGSEWAGQDAIIELDGLEGLKYIAQTRGAILKSGRDKFENGFTADRFQENNPSLQVYAELKKSAINNTYIKTYLDTILKHKKKSGAGTKRMKCTYEEVTSRINKKMVVPMTPKFANELSKLDINRLATDFLKETTRLRKEKYMRVFDRVKFPYDYRYILELVKGKYSDKDRLIEYAVNALRFFKGNDIRTFALAQLARTKRPEIYTNLLIANYKDGDGKLLKTLVDQAGNRDKAHSLVFSYLDIYNANKTKECKLPLIALYNKLTCGRHRKEIVQIMLENRVLPTKIMKEIEFDSYEETRKLYKHYRSVSVQGLN